MTYRIGDPIHSTVIDGREHDTDGNDCWCGPTVLAICEVCAETGCVRALPDCWRCGGRGVYDCDAPALYDGPFGLIVVHCQS